MREYRDYHPQDFRVGEEITNEEGEKNQEIFGWISHINKALEANSLEGWTLDQAKYAIQVLERQIQKYQSAPVKIESSIQSARQQLKSFQELVKNNPPKPGIVGRFKDALDKFRPK